MNYIKQQNLKKKLDLYRISLGMLYSKIKWDFNIKSYKSKKYFKKNKDVFKGKKAVILCNGPSLNDVDFNRLKDSNVFTIGLNKINLLFHKTDFRPNMIVSINKLVIDQNKDFFEDTNIDVILDSSKSNIFKNKKQNLYFIHSLPFQLRFAGDISGSVCQGYTVTYVALQIAFHLGFNEVTLVGCDHNFVTKGSANMTVKSGEKDPNHFAPNYFSNGIEWQLPDLLGSEIHYRMAQEYYSAHDRKIFNSTNGGKLEIFERKSLEEFLNEN